MYLYHLISIDLQSSCSFNSHTLQSLQIFTVELLNYNGLKYYQKLID